MNFTESSETIRGLVIVASSTISFQIASKVVEHYVTPASAKNSAWRWKNASISLLHAFITGIWTILSFYFNPRMAEDLISTYTTFSHSLVAVSVGYFVYDIADMLLNHRSKQSYEFILHHIVIVLCFGIAVVRQTYVGYACVALLVELNSVFLHIRQLLQICGYPKDNRVYRLNSLVNLGTFIMFRIVTLAWMTRWLVVNRDLIPLVFYTIGALGMALMTLMNTILFCRLIHSDFFGRKDRGRRVTVPAKDN